MSVTCGFCKQSTSTKLTEIEPHASNYKYQAVCCTACGAVLGVVEPYNISDAVGRIMKHLKIPFS